MSGATTPYPIGDVKSLSEALAKVQQYFDEMYQERVGGALIGDVMKVGDDEILAVNLSPTGGLQKVNASLAVKPDSTGAITVSGNGLAVLIKGNGGLAKDAGGLFIAASAKGDLIVGTAAGTVANLPIGSAGQVLAVGGAGVTGLEWSNAGVAGPAVAVDSDLVEFDATTGKLIKDGGLSHADVADAVSKKHDGSVQAPINNPTFTGTVQAPVIKITSIKSGATQAAAGAAANEIWKTNGHLILPNNVLMIGI